MFLTEKRCGRVKARECTNCSKQRVYEKKEDAANQLCTWTLYLSQE